MSYVSTGEALKRPAPGTEPSRLRRVRIPGTVATLRPPVVRCPRDEGEGGAAAREAPWDVRAEQT